MKSPFPIYCCSIALRNEPVETALREIAAAGFSGVELWYPHVEKLAVGELPGLKKTCDALGLTIGVISPYFSFTRRRERWEESIRTSVHVLRITEILGIKKVRTFIDCGPDGVASESAKPEDWDAAKEGLQRLCDLAPETNFVVETHEDTLADTLTSAQRIINDVARTNLRLNYQPTRDFMRRGYLECLETLFPAIDHMHWEQLRADGESTYLEEPGAIDFAKLIALLERKNYRGTASVEYCWQPVEKHRLATAGQFLRELLSADLKV